mmetsp:Transcript_13254/g.23847  ORF Transcript_13254/g.23847 Transcript_13254/m.23847 type:complete len:328 (-) Transcript_13254:26-1009(-)
MNNNGCERPSTTTTVILLAGLPASGKSTLAQKLKEHFNQNPFGTAKTHRLIHIEYDGIEDALMTKRRIKNDQSDIATHPDNDTEDIRRREAWNHARQVAMNKLQAELGDGCRDGGDDNKDTIILMDDNFHLRGMRKQVHRFLLTYRPVRFGILWMTTDVKICLERNEQRERKVPVHVITKMASSFEPPRVAWEVNSLPVSENTPIDKIIEFIECCPHIVDLPEDPDAEQQAADRAKTLKNQTHNFDILLRSFVGQVAKFDKQYAKAANAGRKVLLQQLKDGELEIHDDHGLKEAFLDLVLPLGKSGNPDPKRSQLNQVITIIMQKQE